MSVEAFSFTAIEAMKDVQFYQFRYSKRCWCNKWRMRYTEFVFWESIISLPQQVKCVGEIVARLRPLNEDVKHLVKKL